MERITARITKEQRKALAQQAEKDGVSVAEVVRNLIDQHLVPPQGTTYRWHRPGWGDYEVFIPASVLASARRLANLPRVESGVVGWVQAIKLLKTLTNCGLYEAKVISEILRGKPRDYLLLPDSAE